MSGDIDWKRFYDREAEDKRFVPESDPEEAKRVSFVRHLLGTRRYGSALDVGCGDGYLCSLYKSWGYDQVSGVDGALARVEYARSHFPGIEFQHSDIYRLPYDDASFDLVSAVEVVEHLTDPRQALAEMRRVSRGHVLVTVPHNQQLVKVYCPHCLDHFPLDGHIQSFDPQSLSALFSEVGLRPEKVDLSRWFLNRPWLRRLSWPLAWRLAPGWFRSGGFLGVLGSVSPTREI